MRSILRNIYLKLVGTFKKPKPGIHIINSHYASPHIAKREDEVTFEKFLKHLLEKCSIIDLEKATELIITRQIPTKEVLVALTFDDGFEECYKIIAPVLEKYNCRGAFFINANFIDCGTEYQNEFNKRINVFTKKPMTWPQIIDLHKRGHIIGSHGLDHLNMAELTEEECRNQISKNKKILEEKLNYKCEYFAWTYGQMRHFPENTLRETLKFHKYIFSSDNYKKYFSLNKRVINRRHIEPFWPVSHMNYFLAVNKVQP